MKQQRLISLNFKASTLLPLCPRMEGRVVYHSIQNLWFCIILIGWCLLTSVSLGFTSWSIQNFHTCLRIFILCTLYICPWEQACNFVVQIFRILNILNSWLISCWKRYTHYYFRFITFSRLFFQFWVYSVWSYIEFFSVSVFSNLFYF